MKITFRVLLIFIAFSVSFCACKKGENDPFLSLKSRTARLQGDWTLTGGVINYTSGNYTEVETYDGSVLSTVLNGNTVDVDVITYSEKFTFDRNGTYTRFLAYGSKTEEEEGNWAWNGKCKESELKNKESLNLWITHSLNSDGIEYSFVNPDNPKSWTLDELSSKKFVVKIDYIYTSSGYTYRQSGNLIYEKIK